MANFSIIDRRTNGRGKSVDNRQKFLKRVRESIKKSLPDIINNRKIKDMDSDGGVIYIPQKSINEPSFRHGPGGTHEVVRPGNKDFNTGDRFRKPNGGQGGRGKKGSNEGSGEDDFMIEISREEFLDYFFEDLELPDMVKQGLKEITTTKYHNAGYTMNGTPAKLDVRRSLRNSHSRRLTTRGPYKKKILEAEAEIKRLEEIIEHNTYDGQLMKDCEDEQIQIMSLQKAIQGYRRKIENVPFIDPYDLRYHSTVAEEFPVTSAVMFCVMDNSGSMGYEEKTLSRKFFALLYMFLKKKYDKVTLRFVSHTTYAKEVDEEEFFNTRESGGTVVSTALELVNEIINKDYGNDTTNIYVCQCSDGDNWDSDNGTCYELLVDDIMPKVQYYGYIQVGQEHGHISDIWASYDLVAQEFSNFQMAVVHEDADIYPVFRELFEKKSDVK